MRRLFHYCQHFRGWVNACTCHRPLPVSFVERMIVSLAVAKLLAR